ncbi:hypothetical protein B484DRAFT_471863, partial [Ochromonadaceae sp. CCMP2298]
EERVERALGGPEEEGPGPLACAKEESSQLICLYLEIWAELSKPEDMAPHQINSLQRTMDEFCRLFVHMYGRNNVTNYIHLLQAGHFRYFLRKFGNLYRHANIGLEACVKVMRTYWERGTQHGGFCGYAQPSAGNEATGLEPVGYKEVKKVFASPKAMSGFMINRTLYLCSLCTEQPEAYLQAKIAEGAALEKEIKSRKFSQI